MLSRRLASASGDSGSVVGLVRCLLRFLNPYPHHHQNHVAHIKSFFSIVMTVMLMLLFHEVRNEVGVDDCAYTLCVWRIMALMITPAICDNGGDEGDQ